MVQENDHCFLDHQPDLALCGGTFVTGWVLIGQFIFTLALALQCYPLQPGGLLAIEAIAIGMADPHTVFHEAEANFEVILLLMFMVAGIYFMKELLLFIFTKILLRVRSKSCYQSCSRLLQRSYRRFWTRLQ